VDPDHKVADRIPDEGIGRAYQAGHVFFGKRFLAESTVSGKPTEHYFRDCPRPVRRRLPVSVKEEISHVRHARFGNRRSRLLFFR
jgi:hypothetical protein